jgi:hypothetical protein
LHILLCAAAFAASTNVLAQGDGPRAQAMLPVGVNVLVPTYLDLTGNFNPGGNILIPDADISSDVLLVTYMRGFALGKRYAQVYATPMIGDVDGRGTVAAPGGGAPLAIQVDHSGMLDPIVSFKVGLIGMEPLAPQEFAQRTPGFELAAFASVNAPFGDYESDRLVNLGTNVWSLRLGLPMMIPLGEARGFFLELHPSVTFYEDNDDPTRGAGRVEQDPLFIVESHVLHNFNPKLWGSIDLRYRQGGETTTDGIEDNNESDVLGGGFTLGHALTPRFSVQGSLGDVLTERDGSELEMCRFKVVYTF